MSKMDNLRAMREARYEAAQKLAKGGAARPPVPPATKTATAKAAPAAAPDVAPTGETLCGHRNMSGRTCTREHGHAAKSHRYS